MSRPVPAEMSIHTARLDLVPLTPLFLRAAAVRDLAATEQILGFSIDEELFDADDLFELRLQELEVDPNLQPWMLRAIVLREGRMMVGHIGFHTAPGAEYLRGFAPAGVEFGFTVFSQFRRKGYAREASLGMMRWALDSHGTNHFVLSIQPSNVASQNLALSLGFVRVGSQMDDVDGWEDVFARTFA